MAEDVAAPLALGLDLGTSGLKAALIDARGELLGSGAAPIATRASAPGAAEQDTADWRAAAQRAVARLAQRADADIPHWRAQIGAIGLAGQLPTLVVLGEHGPLGPAITWKDARADATALGLIGARRRELYESTGMPIDGRYLAPMFHHHWRTRRAEVRAILSAKDYLCCALTDARLTDPSTAAGYALFDLAAGEFSAPLCAFWDVPATLLPQVRPAHSVAGALHERGATLLGLRPGIPVTVGAADSVASAFAMSPLDEPGRACVAMGSSTVILDAQRTRRTDPQMRYLLTPHVEAPWYAREMDLLATGTGYRWLSQLCGWRPGELERLAAQSPPGANGVSFAPYLAGGEQGALWNPKLRGAIQGLTLATGASDLARAFLEGVAFEIRRCIEVLAETSMVSEIVLAGHLGQLPFGRQLLADVLGRPVQAFAAVAAAAIGAALGSLRALDPAGSVRLRADGPERVDPGAACSAYRSLYPQYLAASGRCGGST
ncbi:MAG TPA: FGGY family carbohydrate kinase [Steroidobacteraceae bacterium]|nr:FGGY family carbohydrate kinase [Steroidobacteraceae bacterium]